MRKKTAQMMRCVPRFGYSDTEVRTVDLDLPADFEEEQVRQALAVYFAARGIADAVYDVGVDEDGYFAVINDDAYEARWGVPLL